MEIENEVKFTNIAKIFIEDFHKGMYHFKDDELILILVNNSNEIETCISLVHDFVLFVLKEIAHFWLSGNH